MDHQHISLMLALSLLLGIPFLFLYFTKAKHIARSTWKSCALFFLVAYAGTFIAAFFMAHMIDPVYYALVQAFRIDGETSAVAAKIGASLIAVLLAYLSLHVIARKRM